ncbi:phospholipase D-like domain-containing protein [Chryseobacterium indologenes]|uniref:phospholipase D-like domain-containing protein n=1 Tax=Chryseobacterium indologenes TaxID=253 RepID=UPI003018FE1C
MDYNLTLEDELRSGFFIANSRYNFKRINKKYNHLFLVDEEERGLRDEIFTIIQNAQTTLKICTFIITDEEIVNEILHKVNQSNIAIFIITQLDMGKIKNRQLRRSTQDDDDLFNTVDVNNHLSNVKKLVDAGVHVRAANNVHAKFIIADRTNGMIMSSNFTTYSLTLNVESGVYIDRVASAELDQLFDAIYQVGTSYNTFSTINKKNKIFTSENELDINSKHLPKSESNLRYTYNKLNNSLYEEIINIVTNADEYVFISSYSIIALDRLPEFLSAVTHAIERGVWIGVFCRGMNNRLDHLESCRLLKSLGCHIMADLYNHSKGVLSEKNGMLFTANIDGKYGLIDGFEVGYVLSEQQQEEFLDFHKYLMDNNIYLFKTDVKRKIIFETFKFYEQLRSHRTPFDSNDLEFLIKPVHKDSFKEISESLLFLGKKNDNGLTTYILIVDHTCYECHFSNNKITPLRTINYPYEIEKYFIKYSNLKVSYINE